MNFLVFITQENESENWWPKIHVSSLNCHKNFALLFSTLWFLLSWDNYTILLREHVAVRVHNSSFFASFNIFKIVSWYVLFCHTIYRWSESLENWDFLHEWTSWKKFSIVLLELHWNTTYYSTNQNIFATTIQREVTFLIMSAEKTPTFPWIQEVHCLVL
jgi:hypothetical protein